jgi:signal transduction histidine kinase
MRLRRRVRTVRFRVTFLAAVAVLVVLAGASAGIVVAQERLLIENLDESIEQAATSIEAALVGGRIPAVLGGFGDDDAFVQVVDRRGVVIAATPNVAGLEALLEADATGRPGVVRTVNPRRIDDGAYRAISRWVDGPGGAVTIHVGATLDDVRESTGVLVTLLTVAVPVVVLLLAGLVWLLVGRTLRPVEAIRAEVAAIGGSELDRRVPEPDSDDEIARLAKTMNSMLDRVETAARQQQQFVADASHELRSPLTRIRSELEVDLAHPGHADPGATHRSVLEEATALQRLVEDLLFLARSDAGATVLRAEPVDLDDIVLRAASALRAEGRVVVDVTGVTAAQVVGDPILLARAIGNLADNAARHAARHVTFAVAGRGEVAAVTVVDDGPGIPPDQQERVFERFTCLDEARKGGGGTGLGLAIARDAVVRHGGTLTVDGRHQPGARFVITLPVRPKDGGVEPDGSSQSIGARPKVGRPCHNAV